MAKALFTEGPEAIRGWLVLLAVSKSILKEQLNLKPSSIVMVVDHSFTEFVSAAEPQ